MTSKTIALIGNPNCGKTTLFNVLTGTYQKTGNWTGVTTQLKEGIYKKDKSIKLVDLPGLYSFNSKSLDERVVQDYIKNSPPDVIINVVDGTNLERNLYLTCLLSAFNVPTIIAVNMIDELDKNGVKFDAQALSKVFGVKVVKISALKNVNVDLLMEFAKTANNRVKKPQNLKNTLLEPQKVYGFLETIIDKIIVKKQTRAQKFTQKADEILTHKFFGLPIFFCVITIVYFLSSSIGGALGAKIELLSDGLSCFVKEKLTEFLVPEFMISLCCDAVLKGAGTVLSFLPQILILFALLTLIEQSGYASRIAFILDRLFRRFGLSGKSLIPFTVSCGCTVAGLNASRTIENVSERRMTIFLSPFMPCGAKTAVFGWFSSVFFNGNALVSASMYFLAIFCTAIFGYLLKKLKPFRSQSGTFILEMPTLRPPALKDICMVLWEKCKDFLVKAGTILFLVSVALWLLKNVGINGYTGGDVTKSFLFLIGNGVKVVFMPLGFGNWQASVSILSGILAKESVVETITLLTNQPYVLFDSIFSVYAFMAFVLLSSPCIAGIVTAKRELGSLKWLLGMLGFQFSVAYFVAFIINGVGILMQGSIGLILCVFIGIIITIGLVLCLKNLSKNKCAGCSVCKKGDLCPQTKKRFTT